MLSPSYIAAANRAQLISFSVWSEAERLTTSVLSYVFSQYLIIEKFVWELLYKHATTLVLAYSFVPWRTLVWVIRFTFRPARAH